jgi:hypothetical protein
MKTPPRVWISLLFLAGVASCMNSPEAMRTRGGGPGADLGNRRYETEMHGRPKIFFQTPCRLPTSCRDGMSEAAR